MRRNVRWYTWLGALILLALVGAFISIAVPLIYLSDTRLTEEVIIPAGEYELHGIYAPGTNDDGPWIVLTHGNRPAGQEHPLYQQIVDSLDDNATVLALDLRGFGKSWTEDLTASDVGFDRRGDIEAAIDYLVERDGAREDQIILMGHSLGASQVLNAAGAKQYRLVIPIGWGDYSIVQDDQELAQYVEKFKGTTGVEVPPEKMRREMAHFTPEALLSPCPETPIALVFGGRDNRQALSHQPERITNLCEENVRWITIPLADHMYGTEGTSLPDLLDPIYSRTMLTLLVRQLNQLIVN